MEEASLSNRERLIVLKREREREGPSVEFNSSVLSIVIIITIKVHSG